MGVSKPAVSPGLGDRVAGRTDNSFEEQVASFRNEPEKSLALGWELLSSFYLDVHPRA